MSDLEANFASASDLTKNNVILSKLFMSSQSDKLDNEEDEENVVVSSDDDELQFELS